MQGTVSRRTNLSGLDSVLLKDLVVCRARQWFGLNVVVGKPSNLRKVDWRALLEQMPAAVDLERAGYSPQTSATVDIESDGEEEDDVPVVPAVVPGEEDGEEDIVALQ
jgi:hypothetical protein